MIRTTGILLCSAALSAVPMMAQVPGGGGGGRGMMTPEQQQAQMDMMTKELSLTGDQVTAIKAVNDDTMKQNMALREDRTMSQEDKRPKMMALREASQTKIKAVLTDEQKPKYDAMLAKMRAARGGGGGTGAPPPPPPQL